MVRYLNKFILTDIGKVITRTTVQYPTSTETKNLEVKKLIRDYHTSMDAAIGAAVVITLVNDDVLVYYDELRDLIKADNGAYHDFEKNIDVDEYF